jgi:hypothetical protein
MHFDEIIHKLLERIWAGIERDIVLGSYLPPDRLLAIS